MLQPVQPQAEALIAAVGELAGRRLADERAAQPGQPVEPAVFAPAGQEVLAATLVERRVAGAGYRSAVFNTCASRTPALRSCSDTVSVASAT